MNLIGLIIVAGLPAGLAMTAMSSGTPALATSSSTRLCVPTTKTIMVTR